LAAWFRQFNTSLHTVHSNTMRMHVASAIYLSTEN
jgi:hypothetical protein